MNPAIKFPEGLTEEQKKAYVEGFNAGILHAIDKIQSDLGIVPRTNEQEDELHADRSESARHDAEVDAAQEASSNQATHE